MVQKIKLNFRNNKTMNFEDEVLKLIIKKYLQFTRIMDFLVITHIGTVKMLFPVKRVHRAEKVNCKINLKYISKQLP